MRCHLDGPLHGKFSVVWLALYQMYIYWGVMAESDWLVIKHRHTHKGEHFRDEVFVK